MIIAFILGMVFGSVTDILIFWACGLFKSNKDQKIIFVDKAFLGKEQDEKEERV